MGLKQLDNFELRHLEFSVERYAFKVDGICLVLSEREGGREGERNGQGAGLIRVLIRVTV